MKIYSADTWTLEELQEQISDAGRRTLLVPPATTKQAVLEVFGQVLDFPEYYGVNLDALNDSLHDYADALSEDDGSPVTMLWQVPAAYRTDRSFGVVCEILQDAERYAGRDLAVIAVFEN